MADKMLIAQQINRAIQFMADSLNLSESKALEIADLYEPWAAGKTYITGKILKFGVNADGETNLFVVLQDHISQEGWTPDTASSLYKQVGFDTVSGFMIWTQPLGATDAYDEGDKVVHGGRTWSSIVKSNVWEPGVYGWEEV